MSGDFDYVKDKMTKRRTDIWNENAQEDSVILEQKTETFIRNLAHNPNGVVAEREKFIHGMKTNSHKVLPPNKKVE